MTNAIERSTMRKIYLRLLPLAVVSYLLAYIDRINVSFAGLRMHDDLNMPADAFGFALGTFYWGYSIFRAAEQPDHREGRRAAVDRPHHDLFAAFWSSSISKAHWIRGQRTRA